MSLLAGGSRADRRAAASASTRARRHRRPLLAALRTQPAQRRRCTPRPATALDELRVDPWRPVPDEAAVVAQAFTRGEPMLVTDLARRCRTSAARLGTPSALLLPLTHGDDRLGLSDGRLSDAAGHGQRDRGREARPTCDAFVTALELLSPAATRRPAARPARAHRRLLGQHLRDADLTAGLEIFCVGANRLFGADRTSVWVHDRRARQLVLQGSSDPEHVARGVQRATRTTRWRRRPSRCAARAPRSCRRETPRRPRSRSRCAATAARSARSSSTAPRRSRRRARPARPRLTNSAVSSRTRSRRPSCSTTCIRSRRELENAFDSIWHLVVVVDRFGQDRPGQRRVREPSRTVARRAARPAARRVRRRPSWRGGSPNRSGRRPTRSREPPAMRELMDSGAQAVRSCSRSRLWSITSAGGSAWCSSRAI